MFQRTFDFQMVSDAGSSGVLVLRLPVSLNQPANTGDLTLQLTENRRQFEGTLGGGGLSDDGVHTFYVSETRSRTGVARVTGRRLSDNALEGTFSGYVTFSVFRTAAGGECTATDHTWRATPR